MMIKKEGMENSEKYHIVVAKYNKDVSFLDETKIPYTVVTKEKVQIKAMKLQATCIILSIIMIIYHKM